MEQTIDWSRFSVRINVRAPLDILYRAWATQEGIESWFLRYSAFTQPDGRSLAPKEPVTPGSHYHWRWHGWPDEVDEKGDILEANGRDRISFSFGKAGICHVSIIPYQDEFVVGIDQDEIPDDETGKQTWHVGCKTGWTFYLANLKSIYEGGIDLRNRDINLQDVLNK